MGNGSSWLVWEGLRSVSSTRWGSAGARNAPELIWGSISSVVSDTSPMIGLKAKVGVVTTLMLHWEFWSGSSGFCSYHHRSLYSEPRVLQPGTNVTECGRCPAASGSTIWSPNQLHELLVTQFMKPLTTYCRALWEPPSNSLDALPAPNEPIPGVHVDFFRPIS